MIRARHVFCLGRYRWQARKGLIEPKNLHPISQQNDSSLEGVLPKENLYGGR